jgi:putative ABC transport system permease protein
VLSGIGFGLLPALRALKVDLRTALAGAHGSMAPRHGVNHGIVAAETALAAVLVLSAGLLVKSFGALQRVDLGFATEDLVTLELAPPSARHPDDAARRRYFEAVVERAAAVPGVASAAVMARAPMTPGDTRIGFQLPGDDADTRRSTRVRAASPAFLDTLGVPLLAGRLFDASDHADAPPVGLVNEALARELWGDGDPIGRRLVFDDGSPWFTVVGLVGNTRHSRLDEPFPPQAYRPLAQASWETRMTLLARLRIAPDAVLPSLEQAVWSVDPDVPIARVASMDALVSRSLGEARLLTLLFTLFGGLALVLGVVGVFGVTSYAVSQRLRESGIRLALGATSGDVVRSVLARTLLPVGGGLAFGCLAFWWVGRLLAGHLYQVQPGDPAVLAAVTGLLAFGALTAAWLPARRATRVDPVTVLKAE